MTNSIILSIIWSSIIFFSYIFYIKEIVKWGVKPHIFSWFLWSSIVLTWYFIQFQNWAWYWSLILLSDWILWLIILALALKQWKKDITLMDKIILILWLVAIYLYAVEEKAFESIILLIIADTLAYLPTFRKSFSKPFEESTSIFILWSIATIFWILAMDKVTFLTAWYQSAIFFINILLIFFIIIRRKIVWQKKENH